ncbi:MAG: SpoIIE family protein phosphatase [candidate division Zixibacteria bacterium]|nr:SpoIIE family protein phosphatase [candidate division Zixibacteria bacterium]
MNSSKRDRESFSEFRAKSIADFYRETRPLFKNSGVAIIIHHRLRVELEIHLFWDEKEEHYSLRGGDNRQMEQLASGDVVEQDPVFASICDHINYLPGEYKSYRFEAADNISGMLFLFARERLGTLGDYITDNLNLTILRLNNAILQDALSRNDLELELLQETGEMLSMSVKLNDVFHSIVKALNRLLSFDAVGIFIFDQSTENIEEIFSHGYQRADSQQLLELKAGRGLVGWVAKTGEPAIVPDVSKDPRYIEARHRTSSELVIPLFSGGEVIGAFNLESDNPDAFSPSDLDMVTAFANQASLSVVRARLFEQAVEKQKIEDELQLARSIQKSFLPDHFPELAGFDLDAINVSSEEVGGDYFDLIPIVDNQLGIAIADVSGRGVPAALIMASFRASLIAEIRNNYAIRTIMHKVNNLICESVKRGEFVTAVYGVLDIRNKILTFTNAGHNPPFILRRSGEIEFLEEGGLTLGIIPDRLYEERPVRIGSGDILVFYTDGITEAENENSEQFGTERLVELVRKERESAASEIRARIVEEIHAFKAVGTQLDDLTLMVIKAE